MRFIGPNFGRRAQHFEQGAEQVAINQNRMLRRIGRHMIPILKAETPTGANHHLRNKTAGEIIGGFMAQRLEIRQGASSKRGFFYGSAVRMGTRPHFPPYRELIPWVTAKMGYTGSKASSVAFLVARKISRFGTKPNRYHERALIKGKAGVQQIVSEEGQNLVAWLNS